MHYDYYPMYSFYAFYALYLFHKMNNTHVQSFPGHLFNIKTVLYDVGIPSLNIKRPRARLAFIMGILVLGRRHLYIETASWPTKIYPRDSEDKYSLLMHCIKIKSPAKFLLNEQYVFVGGNIYFLCVLSCSSQEA